MIVSSASVSFSARSLAVLQSLGSWMTIAPEQTYVATSIRGLGACKSTYCKAERRDLPVRTAAPSGRLAALLALAVAASGLLSGFAAHRIPAEARDMAEPDQLGPGIADCQKSAAPVSPGASVEESAAVALSCGSRPAVAAAETGGTMSGQEGGLVDPAVVLGHAGTGAREGFAGG